MEGQQQQPDGRQIALPPVQPDNPLARMFDQGNPLYLTGIDESTSEGKVAVYRCLTEKGEDAKKVLNTELAVTNWLATQATFADQETGDIVTTVVTRLLLDDGTWIETHSSGVFKCLQGLIRLFGNAPWKPAVVVKLVSETISNGRNWYVLKLVTTQPRPTSKPQTKGK